VFGGLLSQCRTEEGAPSHTVAAEGSAAYEPQMLQTLNTSRANPQPAAPTMQKLYKRQADGGLAYHEAWQTASGITEHWGRVGERGETREHAPVKTVDEVLLEAKRNGFSETNALRIALIEYTVNGMGTSGDLEKRHALEGRMDETLGWTGLGHCDGGGMGSGTMEVAVAVVDVDVAKRVIATDLRGTLFQDYTRIYAEDAE